MKKNFDEPETLTRTLKLADGPVAIKNHAGKDINAQHELWEGMTTSEYYPPNASSADDILEIEQLIMEPEGVPLLATWG